MSDSWEDENLDGVGGGSVSRGLKTEWKNLSNMLAMPCLSVVKETSDWRKWAFCLVFINNFTADHAEAFGVLEEGL
jgi:hypothetical protein